MSTRCSIEFYHDKTSVSDVFAELGEPAARIFKHSDGYPNGKGGVLALLKQLERRLAGKDSAALKKFPHPLADVNEKYKTKTLADYVKIYGSRLDDPEWAAAEFISMFRKPMSGDIYVTQTIPGDIAYLYRVICLPTGLVVKVFRPRYDNNFDIVSFAEFTPEQIKTMDEEQKAHRQQRLKEARRLETQRVKEAKRLEGRS